MTFKIKIFFESLPKINKIKQTLRTTLVSSGRFTVISMTTGRTAKNYNNKKQFIL